MRIIFILFCLLLTGIFTACDQMDTPSGDVDIAGLWSLYIMEQQDPQTGEWHEWRNGMQGFILYDGSDAMALHLTSRGYEDFDIIFPNFTDTIPLEALRHLTNSYVYFARYKVDKVRGVVEHARISHSNPAEWNKPVTRKYTIRGDTLVLEPVEAGLSNLRLKWLKAN